MRKEPLILTRSFNEENLTPFLKYGAEATPSIAAHKYNKFRQNNALKFGDYTFLANPDELDPKHNFIYKHDAWTPLSPRLYPTLGDKELKGLWSEFGNIPNSQIESIAKVNGNTGNLSKESKEELYPLYMEWAKKNNGEWGKSEHPLNMDDFLAQSLAYMQKHSSGVRSYDTPLDENSLKKFLMVPNNEKSYWMQKINGWNAPISSVDEMKYLIDNFLETSDAASKSPQRAYLAIRQGLNDEFNKEEDELKEDAIDDYLEGGHYPANQNRLIQNNLDKNKLDDFLEDINKFIRNDKGNPKYNGSKEIGDAIHLLPTDYLEVKPPKIMTPLDYLGVIYPKPSLTRSGKDSLGNSLKELYGDRAIEYSPSTANGENKIAKLAELMRKVGI